MPSSLVSVRRIGVLAATACATVLALAVPASSGAFSWQLPAATVSAASGYSTDADVAVAPDGTTTIVWSELGYPFSWIEAATRPAGQDTFNSPTIVSCPGIGSDVRPRVGFSPDGTTTVVWQEQGSDAIFAATRPPGTMDFPEPCQPGTAPQRLSANLMASVRSEMTAAGDGSVTAVWETSDGTSSWVQSATRKAGAPSFGSPENLSDPIPGDPYQILPLSPQAASGENGATTAVWSRNPGSSRGTIQAATRVPGDSAFGSPQDLSSSGNAVQPQVAVGVSGQTTAVWIDMSARQVESATRQPGEPTFEGPAVVAGSSYVVLDEPPQVAYAPDGQVTTVWGYDETFAATRAPNSSAWGTPVDISAASPTTDLEPEITVAPDGRATVVWTHGQYEASSTTSVLSATRPGGSGEWSSPDQLDGNAGGSTSGPFPHPAIAVAADGRATAVWNTNLPGTPAAVHVQAVSSDATRYALDVKTEGTGSGAVTSSPSGISCGEACSSSFLLSTPVVLTANASAGSSFSGWGGACSGSAGTCTVPILGDRSVTATFTEDAPGPGPTPSNTFRTLSSRARGSSIVTRVRVPGAGKLTQRATYRSRRASSSATRTACTTSRTAKKAGTYTLTCRLNSAARRQRSKGALRVRVRTRFTPTGGTPRSTYRTVVFRSLKPRYTG